MRNFIIPLIGGTGNQLFQIAYAAELNARGYNAAITTSLIRSQIAHKILAWNKHQYIPVEQTCEHLQLPIKEVKMKDLLQLINIYINRRLQRGSIFNATPVGLLDQMSKQDHDRIVLPGYFQTSNHLKAGTVRRVANIFKNVEISRNSKNLNTRAIGVHIRRGDFEANNFLDESYYRNALHNIDPKELIFITNDRKYVYSQFKHMLALGATVSEGRSAADDFNTISQCKTIYIANSTFSYWAAMSGVSNNIIYPDQLKPSVPFDYPRDNRFIPHDAIFEK